jgi:chemotaxis protein CheZ
MTVDPIYKRDQVVRIINSVLGQMRTPAVAHDDALGKELGELKAIIEDLGAQLNENQIHEISDTDIPIASDELNAVLGATEDATNTIMQSSENILDIMANQNKDISSKVEENIIKIFEACTFQDVTGQRIKKVSSCLKKIEEKTSAILQALGGDQAIETPKKEDASSEDDMSSLMNGPALPQNAVTQDDIDKLLAEFDEPHA